MADPASLFGRRPYRNPWSEAPITESYERIYRLRDLRDARRIRERQLRLQQATIQEHMEDRQRAARLRDLFAQNPNPTFQDVAQVDPNFAYKFDTEQRQREAARLTQEAAQRKARTEQQQQVADVLYGVRNVPGDKRQAA